MKPGHIDHFQSAIRMADSVGDELQISHYPHAGEKWLNVTGRIDGIADEQLWELDERQGREMLAFLKAYYGDE